MANTLRAIALGASIFFMQPSTGYSQKAPETCNCLDIINGLYGVHVAECMSSEVLEAYFGVLKKINPSSESEKGKKELEKILELMSKRFEEKKEIHEIERKLLNMFEGCNCQTYGENWKGKNKEEETIPEKPKKSSM